MTSQATYNLQSPPAGEWSGRDDIPAIGSRVNVRINGMGKGTVKSYFIEDKWIGVEVQLDEQPAWHIKQCGKGKMPLVFGVEIDAIKE